MKNLSFLIKYLFMLILFNILGSSIILNGMEDQETLNSRLNREELDKGDIQKISTDIGSTIWKHKYKILTVASVVAAILLLRHRHSSRIREADKPIIKSLADKFLKGEANIIKNEEGLLVKDKYNTYKVDEKEWSHAVREEGKSLFPKTWTYKYYTRFVPLKNFDKFNTQLLQYYYATEEIKDAKCWDIDYTSEKKKLFSKDIEILRERFHNGLLIFKDSKGSHYEFMSIDQSGAPASIILDEDQLAVIDKENISAADIKAEWKP